MTRSLATRIAFTIIVVFVIAQVAWWLIFQSRLVNMGAAERQAAWQRDVTTANALLEREPDLLPSLLATYPHLREAVRGAGTRVEVDPQADRAALERDQSARRMMAFEGPFFAVVILILLAWIASSLWAERELQRRQQNFLSAVTHEFKTPIGTLRLLAETLRYRDLPREKATHYLDRIDGELGRLERTSNEVLAAARLETHHDPLALEERDCRGP